MRSFDESKDEGQWFRKEGAPGLGWVAYFCSPKIKLQQSHQVTLSFFPLPFQDPPNYRVFLFGAVSEGERKNT